MIALATLLAIQAAPPAAPAQPVAVRPASPRTLSGRFGCDATVYEVAVTATAGQPARLDRLAVAGRAVDAGSLAEAGRMIARLDDVQSLDVRCRADGAGLSIYGVQRQPTGTRRARLRGEWRGARVEGLTFAVEQR